MWENGINGFWPRYEQKMRSIEVPLKFIITIFFFFFFLYEIILKWSCVWILHASKKFKIISILEPLNICRELC